MRVKVDSGKVLVVDEAHKVRTPFTTKTPTKCTLHGYCSILREIKVPKALREPSCRLSGNSATLVHASS